MNTSLYATRCWKSGWSLISSLPRLQCGVVLVVLAVALGVATAHASPITGTLSNFDTYPTTDPGEPPEPTEGAEIELEGVHSSDIGGTYPSHYDIKTIVEYNDTLGSFAGTRITFKGYNFNPVVNNGSLSPVINPINTNGHTCVNTEGCEHFGFWIKGNAQPTAKRFFWLNDNNGTYERIGTMPETIPGPVWNYNPGNGGGAALEIEIEVPEPVEVVVQRPDSTWMKVFKVKFGSDFAPGTPEEMQILLEDLNSGNVIVPEDVAELETEWELLEGGKPPKVKVDPLQDSDKLIVRRYEFFEYIGPVTAENEPDFDFLGHDITDPTDVDGNGTSYLGNFISANMVAAVVDAAAAVPEPSSAGLLLISGLVLMGRGRRPRGRANRLFK